MAYTYQDFVKEAEKEGLYGSFSPYDLELAKRDADAGMNLLRYKKDYVSATSEQARALANSNAENIRQKFNYLGGEDGSKYLPFGTQQSQAPTQQQSNYQALNPNSIKSPYTADVNSTYSSVLNHPSFSSGAVKPSYNNRYDAQTQKTMQDILNRPQFSYDPNTDQNTKYYTQTYQREGKRAAENALGIAAASTGGMTSSYAVTAASQANDYYAAQLADKYPELYQAAYNRYMNDISAKRNDVSMLQGAEQIDYSKYQTDLGQFNTDRNFDYNKWLGDYEVAQGKHSTAFNSQNNYVNNEMLANEAGYNREQDAYNQQLQRETLSYNKQQQAEDTAYNRQQDSLNWDYKNNQFSTDRAYAAAELGDFSQLDAMGIDTTQAKALYSSQLVKANKSAGVGAAEEVDINGAFSNIMSGKWSEDETNALIANGVPAYKVQTIKSAYKAFLKNDFSANVINTLVTELGISTSDLKILNSQYGSKEHFNQTKEDSKKPKITPFGLR